MAVFCLVPKSAIFGDLMYTYSLQIWKQYIQLHIFISKEKMCSLHHEIASWQNWIKTALSICSVLLFNAAFEKYSKNVSTQVYPLQTWMQYIREHILRHEILLYHDSFYFLFRCSLNRLNEKVFSITF